MSPSPLFDREVELDFLNRLVREIDAGGDAIVLRGEAGVGKSALLAEVVRLAETQGFAVLATTGVQAETQLPFAGLHQLLHPVLAHREALPRPLRLAIEAAFGMADTAAPELFLIALAALELLGDAAARSPVLLVAEDAHWLDRPTCEVLAFVARRLKSEPIVLLAAVRDGYQSPIDEAGLPELGLGGLDEAASADLLDAVAPDMTPELRTRLLDEAAGNPLALIELPAGWSAGNTLGTGPFPTPIPMTARLEEAFAVREAELSPVTRSLLCVAAADDGDALAEILSAAEIVRKTGVSEDALKPAITAGLIDVDDVTLRFRHPLVRSSVYQSAHVADRRAAHSALAAVVVDPDRRAWHTAAAVADHDESAASELEAAARRAERRGGAAVAVMGWERAADLSVDPALRATRLLHGAALAFEIGRRDTASRLLDATEQLELAPQQEAERAWIRDSLGDDKPTDEDEVRRLVDLADEMRLADDDDLALKLLLGAALRTWWGGTSDEVREAVLAAASRVQVNDLDPRLLAVLAVATPSDQRADVIARVSRVVPNEVSDPGAGFLLGLAATALGEFERADAFFRGAAVELRALGKLALLAQTLIMQAWCAIGIGDWMSARSGAEEGGRLARETAQVFWTGSAQIAEALVASIRGDDDLAEVLAQDAERIILQQRVRGLLTVLQLARGVAALTGGRSEEAYDHFRRIFDPEDAAHNPRERFEAIFYFVDAAVQSGHTDEARNLITEFASLAEKTGSPSLRTVLSYARPLLDVDADADVDPPFETAPGVDALQRPFFRARLQLAHGIWLRRHRHPSESRAPLRTAAETFDALGAVPWADRARRELRASGETSRQRAPHLFDQLTPQELQIAHMAAEGLSNREIAQQLYLSHRTIGTHLYRLFPKLGIKSRSQLSGVLPPPVYATPPPR